jgi:formylglycine-generating enzyme required for sulfatase activity
MADIFLSYTRADRDIASRIVVLLEAHGWSVWWDAEISGGRRWDAEIETEINSAHCVVALWTPRSIDREFVLAEANRGRERGTLVPILIDCERPPLAFGLVQARDLSGWDGASETATVRDFLADVRRKLMEAPSADPEEPESGLDGRIHLDVPITRNRRGKWFKLGGGKAEWFKDVEDAPEMVVVPAGSFTMGSPPDEPQREQPDKGAESPQHRVTIAAPFAVGRYAVTRREFRAFVQATNHQTARPASTVLVDDLWLTPPDASWRYPGFEQQDNHPVTCVNWEDAKAYVLWLTQHTGKPYRLLSEAEWESVARAGTTTPFWWGSEITPAQANYDGRHLYAGGGNKGDYRKVTVPAQACAANPWGLYNVHGNVWEWCEDVWHASYEGAPSNGTPRLQDGNTHLGKTTRILRGGSWYAKPWNIRSASREWAPQDARVSIRGFRVARDLAENPAEDDDYFRGEKDQRGIGILVGRTNERSQFKPGKGRSERFRDSDTGPEMIVVPAGRFMMGAIEHDAGRPIYNDARANPRHLVTIAAPFAIGRYAVTRGQFAAFIKATGHAMTFESEVLEDGTWLTPGFPQDDNHPVVCVKWGDALAYANWLAAETGKPYRLLSEAEWEYACRAGTPSIYWWGDDIATDQANYMNIHVGTLPVENYEANPWGLYQMHGNVREWCADDVFGTYVGAPQDGAPWIGDGFPNEKVIRGGAWSDDPSFLRSASRNNREANGLTLQRRNIIGFRVARDLANRSQ